MNLAETSGWALMFASDNPQLPSLWMMQVWLNMGWAVVTAWLGGALVQRWIGRRPLVVFAAMVCVLWAWLPSSYASSYWLGLAFQMPSIATVLLCAALLWNLFLDAGSQTPDLHGRKSYPVARGWAMVGVLCSVCLALDAFAVFPASIYAWGFSGAAVVVAMALSLLPWVVWRNQPRSAAHWIAPLAIAWFVVLRLPTGNLWDALLDPWLGVGLTVYLVRQRSQPQQV